ncbi:E3 ubiquitin ligase, partial [Baffinella frigidus]
MVRQVDILLFRLCSLIPDEAQAATSEAMLAIVATLVTHAQQASSPLEADLASAAGDGWAPAAAGEENAAEAARLTKLLDCVGLPSVRSRPVLLQTLAQVLPFLTRGRKALLDLLVKRFLVLLAFAVPGTPTPRDGDEERATPAFPSAEREGDVQVREEADESEAYIECFVCVVQRLGADEASQRLRESLTERGVVAKMRDELRLVLPPGDTPKDDEAWVDAIGVPALPQILQLLAGITRGFAPAQAVVAEEGVLASLHVLEGISSDRHTGSMAEALLAALAEGNPEVEARIGARRERTGEDKRARAAAQREKMLKELGMGDAAAGAGAAADAFALQAAALGWDEGDMEEDEGAPICVICHEGYKYKPEEVMGVYVLTRRYSIAQPFVAPSPSPFPSPAAASSPARSAAPPSRSDRCFASVTNLSLVHCACHAAATRADKVMKQPRAEWDGATLRNQNIRANNLLPILGPKTPAHMFAQHAERYWASIAQMGRYEGSRFRMIVYDTRVLLLRLASRRSFSLESGGGSALSNVQLLPFLIQMGYHSLGDPASSAGTPWKSASSALAAHTARW